MPQEPASGREARIEIIRRLFVIFGRKAEERIESFADRLALFDLSDLEHAIEALIASEKTFPAFTAVRAACEAERDDRLAREGRPQGPAPRAQDPESIRALIRRRLKALTEPHGSQVYGIAARINPDDERYVKAHWKQFQETFGWPAYAVPR